jgi:hypothetical protein
MTPVRTPQKWRYGTRGFSLLVIVLRRNDQNWDIHECINIRSTVKDHELYYGTNQPVFSKYDAVARFNPEMTPTNKRTKTPPLQ